MTSLQAYERFLVKVNRTDSNANINVPKGKFVVIYNEQAKRWLKEKLKANLSTEDIDELSDLLVDNEELKFKKRASNYIEFYQPEDFFHFSNSYSIASKGACNEKVLDNWNTKGKDVRILLRDSNNKPSFEYEETLIGFGNNSVKVYFDDFKIKKAFLTYYKEPKEIDVSGYRNSLGAPSTDINPDIPDNLVNEIISRCVLEVTRNVSDTTNFQLSKDRVNTEG